ncbi:hypothetical protein Ocin01_13625, partial [Orchesella cincta]
YNGKPVNWNFLTFAYASCDLYVGTICEPTDLKHETKCNWRKGWTDNYELAINYTAVTEFGFNGSDCTAVLTNNNLANIFAKYQNAKHQGRCRLRDLIRHSGLPCNNREETQRGSYALL